MDSHSSKRFEKFVDKLDFPIQKRHLLEAARMNGLDDHTLTLIRTLPEREFVTRDDLYENLGGNDGLERERTIARAPDTAPDATRGVRGESVIGDGGLDPALEGDADLPPGLEDRGGIEAQQRAGKSLDSGKPQHDLGFDDEPDARGH